MLVHGPLEKTFSPVNSLKKKFFVVDRRPTSGLWDRPFARYLRQDFKEMNYYYGIIRLIFTIITP